MIGVGSSEVCSSPRHLLSHLGPPAHCPFSRQHVMHSPQSCSWSPLPSGPALSERAPCGTSLETPVKQDCTGTTPCPAAVPITSAWEPHPGSRRQGHGRTRLPGPPEPQCSSSDPAAFPTFLPPFPPASHTAVVFCRRITVRLFLLPTETEIN